MRKLGLFLVSASCRTATCSLLWFWNKGDPHWTAVYEVFNTISGESQPWRDKARHSSIFTGAHATREADNCLFQCACSLRSTKGNSRPLTNLRVCCRFRKFKNSEMIWVRNKRWPVVFFCFIGIFLVSLPTLIPNLIFRPSVACRSDGIGQIVCDSFWP